MKILQLKAAAGRGGAETLLLHLTLGLTKAGHDVLTIVAQQGWLADQLRSKGARCEVIPLMGLGQGLRHFLRLRKRTISFHPDVILAHGARVNIVAAALQLMNGAPSVAVEHNIDRWRTSSSFRNLIDRGIAHMNAKRIAVSGAVASMLRERTSLPAMKIAIIPNAIDTTEQCCDRAAVRRRFGIAEDAFAVVVVARLDEQKGHTFLLDAVAQVRRRHPNLKVVCFGDGCLRSELLRQTYDLGLDDTVYFPGGTDGMPTLLPAFDLFVLPSLWEGLPIALLEAMAARVPVIATKVAGIPEVINNRNGVLVPPRRPDALAAAIQEMIERPDRRIQLSKQARQDVVRRYSFDALLASYLAVLHDTAGLSRHAKQ